MSVKSDYAARAILGLLKPKRGRVLWKGEDLGATWTRQEIRSELAAVEAKPLNFE